MQGSEAALKEAAGKDGFENCVARSGAAYAVAVTDAEAQSCGIVRGGRLRLGKRSVSIGMRSLIGSKCVWISLDSLRIGCWSCEAIWLGYDFDPEILQIGEGPEVVVARTEVYLYSIVHQAHKLVYDPCSLTGDDIAVFVPEVPDVAEKNQRGVTIGGKAAQKAYKALLALLRVARLKPEVNVGYEIDS